MMKYILLLCCLLLAGCSGRPTAQSPSSVDLEPLDRAARMALYPVGAKAPEGFLWAPDSSRAALSDFAGQWVVLDFWAEWCAPCLKEAPLFHELAARYDGKAAFLSVSVDDRFEDWAAYLSRQRPPGRHYWLGMKELDPLFSLVYSEHEVEGARMVLIGLPAYVFISPDGVVASRGEYRPSDPAFEQALLGFLGQ